MTDLLSATVAELRLDTSRHESFRLRAPWALSFEPGGRGIHIVQRGRCELHAAGRVVRLEAGDVAILPSGLGHTLRSVGAPRSTPAPAAGAVAARSTARPVTVEGSAGGEETTFLCGLFRFAASDHPVLTSLRPLVHLRAEPGPRYDRVRAYVERLSAEVAGRDQGADAIVARLLEILVVEVLRRQAEVSPEVVAHGGWFSGTRDPRIARALAAVHGDLAAPWSVASLAAVAGQSRSAFARRFAEVMGETPMDFVARWRMFRARTSLRETADPLDAVARSVGYGSGASFSLAFVRAHGVTPGQYRASARERAAAGPGGRRRERGVGRLSPR